MWGKQRNLEIQFCCSGVCTGKGSWVEGMVARREGQLVHQTNFNMKELNRQSAAADFPFCALIYKTRS